MILPFEITKDELDEEYKQKEGEQNFRNILVQGSDGYFFRRKDKDNTVYA